MRVAGIDLSSFAVDVVTVPLDEGKPLWHRFPLTGQDAFDRARSVADAMPSRTSVLWEDVIGIGIEHPAGKFGVGPLLRIQGAILARLPVATLVQPLPPSKWRKLVGLKGNASKDEVRLHSSAYCFVNGLGGFGYVEWPQDAHDAHLIALATQSLIEQKKAA